METFEIILSVAALIVGLAVFGILASVAGVDTRPGFDGRPLDAR